MITPKSLITLVDPAGGGDEGSWKFEEALKVIMGTPCCEEILVECVCLRELFEQSSVFCLQKNGSLVLKEGRVQISTPFWSGTFLQYKQDIIGVHQARLTRQGWGSFAVSILMPTPRVCLNDTVFIHQTVPSGMFQGSPSCAELESSWFVLPKQVGESPLKRPRSSTQQRVRCLRWSTPGCEVNLGPHEGNWSTLVKSCVQLAIRGGYRLIIQTSPDVKEPQETLEWIQEACEALRTSQETLEDEYYFRGPRAMAHILLQGVPSVMVSPGESVVVGGCLQIDDKKEDLKSGARVIVVIQNWEEKYGG